MHLKTGDEEETPEAILAELRRRPGWSLEPDLDVLAQRALERGCLRFAYEAASGKWWNAMGTSSNSSRTVVVFDASGRTEDDEAFLLLIRSELRAVLDD